ncbi:MAG: hypothetical protein HOI23_17435 [Deltaproteobacteria bacterium]|nr:hypothetical protein [Deltaproteobacteria bacterium]MBT6488713.1 hypothetical protein [Deltaproteobacteria bacterium]
MVSITQVDVAHFKAAWTALGEITAMDAVTLVALNLLILIALGARGFMLIRAMGTAVGFLRWLQVRQLAFLVSISTPGPQFGGEPAQVLALKQCGVDSSRGLSITVADKLLDLILNTLLTGILVVWVLAFGLIELKPLSLDGHEVLSALGLGAAVVVAMVIARRQGLFARREFMSRLENELDVLKSLDLKVWVRSVAAGIFALALMGLEWWFLWSLVVPDAGWQMVLGSWLAARVALWAPVPGAMGVLEAGVLAATLALGGDWSEGIAVCALSRARDLGLMISSAVLSFREWMGWRG